VNDQRPSHRYEALTREEVISVIEGRSTARRVPLQLHMWLQADRFGPREAAVNDLLDRFPADIQFVPLHMPGVFQGPEGDTAYRWVPYDDPYQDRSVGLDQRIAIADWGQLDDILERFPSPHTPHLLANAPAPDGRYRVGHWWYLLFERHWSLRGMTNALTDYYVYPEETHRLFRRVTDFYLAAMDRAFREQAVDGIFSSDDLGTQTGPFFSPAIFREFYLPYYRELFDCAHALGGHFWLHACGNVEPFISDWIEAGLDVLHPIQKHTMAEEDIAQRYGDRLTIFTGLDVQQVIPWGTPEEVRAEVRYLLDTYWRPSQGRCMITAGNAVHADCPTESLLAFFEEALSYGIEVAQR
jgi:uroporphyrinogen decarboxylase